MPVRGWLTPALPVEAQGSDGVWVVYPGMAGREPAMVDLLSLTPGCDANQVLLDACQATTGPWPTQACAAVFACDPFRRIQDVVQPLQRAGVQGVTNFPTVGLFDGRFADSLETVGFNVDRELNWLVEAAAQGMQTMAVVCSVEHGLKALALGMKRICVHPGLALMDADANRQSAAQTVELLTRLRAAGGSQRPTLLLYRPAGFGGTLDEAEALADGCILVVPHHEG